MQCIGREKTCSYVNIKLQMNALGHIWDLRIKKTVREIARDLHEARFCIEANHHFAEINLF